MAKHSLQITGIHIVRHLLAAVLALGCGISVGWAEPQSSNTPPPSTSAGQTRPHKASAQRGSATSTASMASGRRDPFKLPEYATGKGEGGSLEGPRPGEVLPPGKRGLVISQLHVEGVVRQSASNRMTALVVSVNDPRKLAYFLHDSDALYNGVVSKITPDAVYFTENVLDPKGHVTTREVVKRLGSASGEGR
jgi:hypothetical protein